MGCASVMAESSVHSAALLHLELKPGPCQHKAASLAYTKSLVASPFDASLRQLNDACLSWSDQNRKCYPGQLHSENSHKT